MDTPLSLSDEMVEVARQMAIDNGCVIAISGEEDCITDGDQVFRVRNGQPIMTSDQGDRDRLRPDGCYRCFLCS
ncbi:MAG: hydroxyethylthiazole kinase [Desulfocapsa sp.]|nr:hydroxyethylthiazole kinase [Desulfocapsa sp.]